MAKQTKTAETATESVHKVDLPGTMADFDVWNVKKRYEQRTNEFKETRNVFVGYEKTGLKPIQTTRIDITQAITLNSSSGISNMRYYYAGTDNAPEAGEGQE